MVNGVVCSPVAMAVTLSGILKVLGVAGEGIAVLHRAKWGETAVLPCPSDDKLHRFQYWLLKNDEVIGPWNNREGKVRYEVWSGKLIIQNVSEMESGLYRCFSKRILGNELRSETVELMVLKDWGHSNENDTKVNIYRAVVLVTTLLIVVAIVLFVHFKRRRRSFTLQGPWDGSPDEAPVNDQLYRATSVSLKKPASSIREIPKKQLETTAVETDVSTSFSPLN